MYFYEIHEGDDEMATAVLLMHEQRLEPAEFFALVKKARLLVLDAYEEDSLAEAIATELERASGFLHVTDERLIASVNVDDAGFHTLACPEVFRGNMRSFASGSTVVFTATTSNSEIRSPVVTKIRPPRSPSRISACVGFARM